VCWKYWANARPVNTPDAKSVWTNSSEPAIASAGIAVSALYVNPKQGTRVGMPQKIFLGTLTKNRDPVRDTIDGRGS
jgi:hypothetical protein